MSRKIILVESCRECPFSVATSFWTDICIKIFGDNEIPGMVYMHGSIWEKCPLDDAEGFV